MFQQLDNIDLSPTYDDAPTALWLARRKREQRRLLIDEFIIGGFTVIGLALIVLILAAAG